MTRLKRLGELAKKVGIVVVTFAIVGTIFAGVVRYMPDTPPDVRREGAVGWLYDPRVLEGCGRAVRFQVDGGWGIGDKGSMMVPAPLWNETLNAAALGAVVEWSASPGALGVCGGVGTATALKAREDCTTEFWRGVVCEGRP